ncbi:MAG: hypothetical protein HY319_09515 [Armatimonadetes bacterium]|nr:hypothetical protein [Armatimonadota bacterium]
MVHRGTGQVLGTLSLEDVKLLRDLLAAEFEEDADYFLNAATLHFLRENGMTAEALETLEEVVGAYGSFDLGLELSISKPSVAVHGKVVDRQERPLGGIRVDLLGVERTEEGHSISRIMGWTFTREDGDYRVELPPLPEAQARALRLRILSRGNGVLTELELPAGLSGEHDAGTATIPTLQGKLSTTSGRLEGGVVQLVHLGSDEEEGWWSGVSWSRTDGDGRFVLAVGWLPDEGPGYCELEIFAASGQPLGEPLWQVDLSVGEELVLEAPEPDPEWPPDVEYQPLFVPDYSSFEYPLA